MITVQTLSELNLLTQELGEKAASQPHVESLLKAFGPLILMKQRWLQERSPQTVSLLIDEQRLIEGIPLIEHGNFFHRNDPWDEAALFAVAAIFQGFPAYGIEMSVISEEIENGRYDIDPLSVTRRRERGYFYFKSQKVQNVNPIVLELFRRFLWRLILWSKRRDRESQMKHIVWSKGYCPVCGSFPQLAVLRPQEEKMLYCSECGHQWCFSGRACPFCENETQRNSPFLVFDGPGDGAAFICRQCKRYLITTIEAATCRQPNSDLLSLGLVHLDLILQSKGFSPMAECEWNVLNPIAHPDRSGGR
ncbi:MAG: formate dehydrogenase accessory protein FdhE [Desulfofustis sp.]|nr:formate dehydrogenase accessory protein FdhE [Desulfofustis sp.]